MPILAYSYRKASRESQVLTYPTTLTSIHAFTINALRRNLRFGAETGDLGYFQPSLLIRVPGRN